MFNGLYYTLSYYFWTNLLTQGTMQIAVFFAYFSVSQKRNIKRSPNGMKPSGAWFLEQTWSRGLGVDVKKSTRRPRGREARLPPWVRPPPSWAPRGSTDLLLPPIYTYVPWKHERAPWKPNSTAATFYTREIPSWAFSEVLPEGALITEGFYINTIASPKMCE